MVHVHSSDYIYFVLLPITKTKKIFNLSSFRWDFLDFFSVQLGSSLPCLNNLISIPFIFFIFQKGRFVNENRPATWTSIMFH